MTKMDPQERYVRGLQHALRTLNDNADDLGWIERDMARDAVGKALAAAQRPLQLQGAASPQGAAFDAENAEGRLASNEPDGQNAASPLADAQSGARPDDPETRQLLQQAAEALEMAKFPLRTAGFSREAQQCWSVAAALRALGER
jgi:hypothetical protein